MSKELTDGQLEELAVSDEFLLYCSQDEFNEIARAVIAADRAARIGEFPALPEPDHATVSPWDKDATKMVFFTAEQMRAYAAQAVEADRAARGVPDGWALDLKQKIKEAIRLSDTVGRSRGLNSYALNTGGVYKLVNLEAEIDAMLAAAPQPAAQPEPCYCDRMQIGDPSASCGDCPTRDYEQVQPLLTDAEICDVAKLTETAEPGRDGYILPVAFARAIIAAHEAKKGAK